MLSARKQQPFLPRPFITQREGDQRRRNMRMHSAFGRNVGESSLPPSHSMIPAKEEEKGQKNCGGELSAEGGKKNRTNTDKGQLAGAPFGVLSPLVHLLCSDLSRSGGQGATSVPSSSMGRRAPPLSPPSPSFPTQWQRQRRLCSNLARTETGAGALIALLALLPHSFRSNLLAAPRLYP